MRAASQSKTEWTERALKGDRAVEALMGESRLDTAGLAGSLMLGKVAGPVGGADMGTEVGKGLGGKMGAVAGTWSLEDAALAVAALGEERGEPPHLQEQSDCSLAAVPGTEVKESGVVSPEARPAGVGELRAIALERKSV